MVLDPEMAAFSALAARHFNAGYEAKELAEQRRIYAEFCREFAARRPGGIKVLDLSLRGRSGPIPARLYRPATEMILPAVIYFHGGGWILGNPDTHDAITAHLALEAQVAVLSVDYRLAPEHPFPAAIEDAYDALCAAAAHGPQHGIDSTRLAVAGDSAGGNLAAAVSLLARDRKGPRLHLQALVYAALSTDFDRPSCWENADAPFLSRASLFYYLGAYLGGRVSSTDPYVAPMEAASHANLPPAFIATAGIDPLRDDGALYAARLRGAGVEVEYRCAPDLPHGYLRALEHSAAVRVEFQALAAAIREGLHYSK